MPDTPLLYRHPVSHSNGSYDLLIGRDLLGDTATYLPVDLYDSRPCIVGDFSVLKLFESTLAQSLQTAGFRLLPTFGFKPGERSKSFANLTRLLEHLAQSGVTRHDFLIALGGGVTGDLAGFAAAVYMRGIRFVQIPTTLLAQADSSIGGKTGVNLRSGKNLAGSFHAPALVLCDLKTLDTLPKKQMRNGLAEIIKMAVIGKPELFSFIELHSKTILLAKQRETLVTALCEAVRLKSDIVEKDEKETGLREALNLGHTFAHGLECVTGYRTLLHGEAVALGLLAAAHLAVNLSLCDTALPVRIRTLLQQVGLPVKLPGIGISQVIDSMTRDKKIRSGTLRFVLPRGIGSVVTTDVAELWRIEESLKALL